MVFAMPESPANPYAPPEREVQHSGAPLERLHVRSYSIIDHRFEKRFGCIFFTPLLLLTMAEKFRVIESSTFYFLRGSW
ncbi:MAG: hypothetical protein ACK58T_26265, partial [Phycisphaerae bacterium]